MAAVRFQGPCAPQAPSSGRSAGGGGTSSGPQHALHSVRWPCWGSLRGPSWAWTTSGRRGCAAALRLHVPGGLRAHGLGSSGKGRDTWQVMPDASSLKWGVRASCFTQQLDACPPSCRGRLLSGQGVFYRKQAGTSHPSKAVMGSSLWLEENKWDP